MSDSDIEAIELAARRAAAKAGPQTIRALIALADEIAKVLRERRPTKPQTQAQHTVQFFGSYSEVEEFINEMRSAAIGKWPEEAVFWRMGQHDE